MNCMSHDRQFEKESPVCKACSMYGPCQEGPYRKTLTPCPACPAKDKQIEELERELDKALALQYNKFEEVK